MLCHRVEWCSRQRYDVDVYFFWVVGVQVAGGSKPATSKPVVVTVPSDADSAVDALEAKYCYDGGRAGCIFDYQ